jgi:hypothetical protein
VGALTFEGKSASLLTVLPAARGQGRRKRVLSLSCGVTDSLLNDSLFAPESDTTLQLDAANLELKRGTAGNYLVVMSGQIGNRRKPRSR